MTLFRRLAIPAGLVGFASLNALASPVACNSITDLSMITGANAGVSCQIDDKIFSNFTFNFLGGTSNGNSVAPLVPSANNVSTTFSDSGLDANGIPASVTLAFGFSSNNTVSANQNMDLQIQYQVAIAPPIGNPSATAVITGISGTGTGAYNSVLNNVLHPDSMYKDACLGAAFDSSGTLPTDTCSTGTDQVAVINKKTSFTSTGNALTPSTVSGNITFLPNDPNQTTVGAFDEFKINGGSNADAGSATTASVTGMSNTFFETDTTPSGTPEPGTMLLMGGALVGLSSITRRKKSV
jgi:PEP-CTERM motif